VVKAVLFDFKRPDCRLVQFASLLAHPIEVAMGRE